MDLSINQGIGERTVNIVKKSDGSTKQVTAIFIEKYLQQGLPATELIGKYPIFDTRIYGGYFQKTLDDQRDLKVGQVLELVFDKENAVDAFAIEIRNGKKKLGFVKKELCWQIENLESFKCVVTKRYLPERGTTLEKGALIRLFNLDKLKGL